MNKMIAGMGVELKLSLGKNSLTRFKHVHRFLIDVTSLAVVESVYSITPPPKKG